MTKLSHEEEYNNLKQEADVIAKVNNFLHSGHFPGAAARDLIACQMYMMGLHQHFMKEVEKRAPLSLPEDKPVVGPAEPLPDDSVRVA